MFPLMFSLLIITALHCVYLFHIYFPYRPIRSIAKMEGGDGAISQGGIVSSLCLDFRNNTLYRST
jgi:hypothetical protein